MKSPFQGLNVLVTGEIGVDLYSFGISTRMSPEAFVPVITGLTDRIKKPGLVGNVVDNIRALGANAEVVTIVGMDQMGDWLVYMASGGYFVRDPSRHTIIKQRVLVNQEQFARVDVETTHALTKAIEQQFKQVLFSQIPNFDAVILQDYGKGLWSRRLLKATLKYCNKLEKPVFLDPFKGRPIEDYRGATLIKPNQDEARSISVLSDNHSDAEVSEELEIRSNAKVVVTSGAAGMSQSLYNTVPRTRTIKVNDVAGCGDTVLSVLTLMLVAGQRLSIAMELANKAAGIKCEKPVGQTTVSWEELCHES